MRGQPERAVLHGCSPEQAGLESGAAAVLIGGLNPTFRQYLLEEFTAVGIRAVTASGEEEIAGISPDNICNRTLLGMGAQLEMTTALRTAMFAPGRTRSPTAPPTSSHPSGPSPPRPAGRSTGWRRGRRCCDAEDGLPARMSVLDGVNESAELGGGGCEDDVRIVALAEADGSVGAAAMLTQEETSEP